MCFLLYFQVGIFADCTAISSSILGIHGPRRPNCVKGELSCISENAEKNKTNKHTLWKKRKFLHISMSEEKIIPWKNCSPLSHANYHHPLLHACVCVQSMARGEPHIMNIMYTHMHVRFHIEKGMFFSTAVVVDLIFQTLGKNTERRCQNPHIYAHQPEIFRLFLPWLANVLPSYPDIPPAKPDSSSFNVLRPQNK